MKLIIEIPDEIYKLLASKVKTDLSMEYVEKTLTAISNGTPLTESDDCVSRAELLKAVDTWDKFGCDADTKLVPIKDCYVPYVHYDDIVKAIKGMPSVQPKVIECDDCVSRKDYLEVLHKWEHKDIGSPICFKQLIVDLSCLPNVQPKRERGKR